MSLYMMSNMHLIFFVTCETFVTCYVGAFVTCYVCDEMLETMKWMGCCCYVCEMLYVTFCVMWLLSIFVMCDVVYNKNETAFVLLVNLTS